jgi:hypothetical protein
LAIALAASRQIISSGSTINLFAYITNTSGNPAQQIAVTLNTPSNWILNGKATNGQSTVTIPMLGAKESTSIPWSIQVPSGVVPGTYPLAVTVAYQSTGRPNSAAGTTKLLVAYPSLASLFDNVGVTSNSNPNPSSGFQGFDGIGTTYSAEGLAAAGITPGSKIGAFTWPAVGPALPDNVLADGQAVLVSGKGSQIAFLGAANNAPVSGSGTVYYTDGTSQAFVASVGNFWYPSGQNGNPDNTQVAAINYANYPTGSSGHTIYLFSFSAAIDSTKTVQAVILPKVTGSVQGSAAAMHIFSIAIQ